MITQQLLPDNVDFVIYHNPCPDGMGSAFCAWKYLSTKYPNRDVTYYPASHGRLPPDVTGKNVLICDFSYKKDVLVDMIKKANSLLILDHHKSAEKKLENIEDVYKVFDMNHSGAVLTWMYFYPEKKIPLMIKYIEDRDIWTKKLPNTDAFASWFHTLPLEFEVYDQYLDDAYFEKMIETKGLSYYELNEHNIENSMTYVVPKFTKIGNKYYFVAYVNSTVLKSDIGNRVFKYFPYVDFSVIYSINDSSDSTSFSLRSTNDRADVSVIASSLGGGGHRNASGAGVNFVTNVLSGQVYGKSELYNNLERIYTDTLIIPNIEYNVVYMNSNVHKHRLGKYLLQDNKVEFILSKCKDKEHNDVKDKYDVAVIWNYDGMTNNTYFTIIFDNNLDEDKKGKFVEHFNVDGDICVREGLCTKLV
jgi:oligoribonuclease NrnB/cAMP/cGMP phosphodiesterase (DHH superfamily)